MSLRYRVTLLVLAGVIAAISLASGAPAFSYPTGSGNAPRQESVVLDNLKFGNFGAAITGAQSLVNHSPDDPFAYEIRAAVALYIGDQKAAITDLTSHPARDDKSPLHSFELAIAALATNQPKAAKTELLAISSDALQGNEGDRVKALILYCDLLEGNRPSSNQGTDIATDPAEPFQREILAFQNEQLNSKLSLDLLSSIVATDTAVPRVTEEIGLHPLFGTGAYDVEPAVADKSLRDMYCTEFKRQIAESDREKLDAQTVSGDTAVMPPTGLSRENCIISVSVDGQMLGIVSTAPYRFTWHTSDYANGWHNLTVVATNVDGSLLARSDKTVYVNNSSNLSAESRQSYDNEESSQLWDLLQPKASLKFAHAQIAILLQKLGQMSAANSHRLISAAIDPDYKNGRRFARDYFKELDQAQSGNNTSEPISQEHRGVTIGPAYGKFIALTFDDGPNLLRTPALLNALESAHAPATFFVVGARASEAAMLVRRMSSLGDEIESHSYTHANMSESTTEAVELEILRSGIVIQSLSGQWPRYFRPPGGNRNAVVYRLTALYRQQVALWTVDAFNQELNDSPQGLADYVVKHARPGAIVLMHNGMDNTTSAIPAMTAELRAKGYHLVTLSQLMVGHLPIRTALLTDLRAHHN